MILLIASATVLASGCATTVKRGKGKKIIDNQQKKHAKKYHRNYMSP
jgi:uncharacterized protein YceK